MNGLEFQFREIARFKLIKSIFLIEKVATKV